MLSIIKNAIAVVKYWYYSYKFPKLRELGFPSQGIAIEQRFNRSYLHWENHLTECKETKEKWLKSIPNTDSQNIWVLGAGRLFDCNIVSLANKFKKVTLVDADPTALGTWAKQQKRISKESVLDFCIQDITGVFEIWISQIKENSSFSQGPEELLSFIAKLPRLSPLKNQTLNCLTEPSVIISLNLLSQIPLMFREWLKTFLIKTFGKNRVLKHEKEWLRVYSNLAQALIEQHLAILNNSKARHILLLTDIEFCQYYNSKTFSSKQAEPIPCLWDKNQGWTTNKAYRNRKQALTLEVSPALFGINLEKGLKDHSLMSNYRLKHTKKWLWHIAPLGIENKVYGTVHRVAAFELQLYNK